VAGIEPASSAWKAEVIAIIRHPHCYYLRSHLIQNARTSYIKWLQKYGGGGWITPG
jgi:hypothetical protein